jgi:cell wall-associated protease
MKVLLGLVLVFSLNAKSATVAIIDSGVDVEHKDFHNQIWTNTVDSSENQRDEDQNGYQDDVYGWNFAESNNLVIDRKYLGTFSETPYKFFDIQGKMFLGTASQEELDWVKNIRNNPEAIAELQKFGNFVHGTHVAGIAIKDVKESQLLSVKLIPTEIKPFMELLKAQASQKSLNNDLREKLLKQTLSSLADQQMTMLAEIAKYVGDHKTDIANGSFGTGYNQARMITDNAYRIVFFKKPTEEEAKKYAIFFMEALIEAGKKMTSAAPKTLFVFAAGNEGSNNDEYPTSPTNIKADNVISVAATMGYVKLAPFSNYGISKVEVAAPGMLIHSQIPGDEYLKVSGTSQAAPYVANIATKVKEINPKLNPLEIKKIIMGTVDVKDYLKEKVASSGIVNLDRAVYAAEMSLKMSIIEALQVAKKDVLDVQVKPISAVEAVTPMSMPAMFQ